MGHGDSLGQVTAVGFETTLLQNGALSHRLRPLGQTVLKRSKFFVLKHWGAGVPAAANNYRIIQQAMAGSEKSSAWAIEPSCTRIRLRWRTDLATPYRLFMESPTFADLACFTFLPDWPFLEHVCRASV